MTFYVEMEEDLLTGTVNEAATATASDGSFDLDAVTEAVIKAFAADVKCPHETQLNIVLVGDEEMRRINAEKRGRDEVTDVLSFPVSTYPAPADFGHLAGDVSAFDPDSGELLLGDVVICSPRLRAQAEAFGHGIKREYAFLLLHSLLHLVGYEHDGDGVMEEKQEAILLGLGICR